MSLARAWRTIDVFYVGWYSGKHVVGVIITEL